MRNIIIALIGIFLISSCHKLKGEEIEPYLGKWKCKGFITKDYDYNYIYETLIPIEECSLEITKDKVIFTNHAKKLKTYIVSFELGQYYEIGGFHTQEIKIVTRDIKGQKRELIYFFKDGYLRGDFFSKNGLSENGDWGSIIHGIYGYHQFEKL